MSSEAYRKTFLGVLVVAVTIAFVAVMRSFLLTLLLAAIFSALLHPFYRRILALFRGHRSLASVTTLLIAVVVILLPLGIFVGVLVAQAIDVSQNAGPWIEARLQQRDQVERWLEDLPGYERLRPFRDQILLRLGELTKTIGSLIVTWLSDATRGTFQFFVHLLITLYSMFFFLMDGPRFLARIASYLPLSVGERGEIVDRFLSVTRAALSSVLVIGVIQGTLAGAALAVAGIPGAVFWGTLMVFLSMIPGVGTALVWLPASIYLIASGRVAAGMLLIAFCGLIVGSIDNVLRPRIVGRETKLHELVVLLSTLGGILLMGPVGFIVGPVIAALFITVWDIYAASQREPSRPTR
jgi:predicted PurR-regulated permease PerM